MLANFPITIRIAAGEKSHECGVRGLPFANSRMAIVNEYKQQIRYDKSPVHVARFHSLRGLEQNVKCSVDNFMNNKIDDDNLTSTFTSFRYGEFARPMNRSTELHEPLCNANH